jgi:hypothetical protein
MSGHWSFHEKTHTHYVWCLSISWQNTLLLCLVLHHFMTKHTATMPGAWPFHDKQIDTMSGSWPFHDKAHCCYVWCLTIAWEKTLSLCLMLDHFMTKHTAILSSAWSFHDKTHCYYVWCLTNSWQTDWYYVWCLTISWQNTLLLCLVLDHFMTKHTATMQGAWPFHDKTHYYYIWVLII